MTRRKAPPRAYSPRSGVDDPEVDGTEAGQAIGTKDAVTGEFIPNKSEQTGVIFVHFSSLPAF